jgi:hypothetical protein
MSPETAAFVDPSIAPYDKRTESRRSMSEERDSATDRPGRSSTINLLFLCLARDCAKTIPTFFSYLRRLDDYGFRCAAIIGENGSRDGTRALITRAVGERIALLDTSFMAQAENRLQRMAMGREALKRKACERQNSPDYVCVADLDNVMSAPPDPAAVAAAIGRLRADGNLFAVGANSTPFYYDLLSLRAAGHDYSSLNAEIARAKKNPFTYFQFHQRRIYDRQQQATSQQPMRCLSSFNGFCVYDASSYGQGTYRAGNEAEICEHVTFNLSIARHTGKDMLIAPELIVQMPPDHAPTGFFRFWVDRIAERIP